MPLLAIEQLLEEAYRHKYGIAMFEVDNTETIESVIKAAQDEHSPIMLGVDKLDDLSYQALSIAKNATIPVAVQYRGKNFETIIKAIYDGFNCISYDCSNLSYEQNVRDVQEVMRIAKILGISVEGKIDNNNSYFYKPCDKPIDFILRTNVNLLELGSPREAEEIKKRTKAFISLSNASMYNDYDLEMAVAAGISKFNFSFKYACIDMKDKAMNDNHVSRCDEHNCIDTFSNECLRNNAAGEIKDRQYTIVKNIVQRVLLQLVRENDKFSSYIDDMLNIQQTVRHKIKVLKSKDRII